MVGGTYSLSCVGEEPLLFDLKRLDHLAQRRVVLEDIFQGQGSVDLLVYRAREMGELRVREGGTNPKLFNREINENRLPALHLP